MTKQKCLRIPMVFLFTPLTLFAQPDKWNYWIEGGLTGVPATAYTFGACGQYQRYVLQYNYSEYQQVVGLFENYESHSVKEAATNSLTAGYSFQNKRVKLIPYLGVGLSGLNYIDSVARPATGGWLFPPHATYFTRDFYEYGLALGIKFIVQFRYAGFGFDYHYYLEQHSYRNFGIVCCIGKLR